MLVRLRWNYRISLSVDPVLHPPMALEELGGREDSCAYDGPRHRRCAGRIRQLLIDKKDWGLIWRWWWWWSWWWWWQWWTRSEGGFGQGAAHQPPSPNKQTALIIMIMIGDDRIMEKNVIMMMSTCQRMKLSVIISSRCTRLTIMINKSSGKRIKLSINI